MISISTLFSAATADAFLAKGLEIARVLGLPVSTWQAGDPTRSLYKYLAEVLATLDGVVAEYIKSGFLSSATRDWLTILAYEVYGVERVAATYATPTCTLLNSGGGLYSIDAGDITVRSSFTGKTYRNTNSGTLASGPGNTLLLELIADQAGSDSTVSVDEIDEMVTALVGVTVASSTLGVGADEQSDESLREQCRSTLGALSPNGPRDAFEYVVRNPTLTGSSEITRAKAYGDEVNGDVTVYVATPSGAASGAAVAAAQAAVEQWATPLCFTPTVVAAVPVAIDVTATPLGDGLPADLTDLVRSSIATYLAELPIGSLVAVSAIIARIHAVSPRIKTVSVATPAADMVLTQEQVPVLGNVVLIGY